MFALKVTPRKDMTFPLNLFFNILVTLFKSKFDLFSFELITLLTTVKLILKLLAVDTIAFVSLGKHDPP